MDAGGDFWGAGGGGDGEEEERGICRGGVGGKFVFEYWICLAGAKRKDSQRPG